MYKFVDPIETKSNKELPFVYKDNNSYYYCNNRTWFLFTVDVSFDRAYFSFGVRSHHLETSINSDFMRVINVQVPCFLQL